MSDYAIGDVQGCFDALQRLLCHIQFNEHTDRLWFTGDLVNRGPDSLAVLRFIKALPRSVRITLGNHDLHLLSRLFNVNARNNDDDTLDEILKAPDAHELGHWLRTQSMLYHDPELNVVMTHAGIAPMWDLPQAIACAAELEKALSGEEYQDFLAHMYGNEPDHWHTDLTGIDRLRVICNYLTRMRFCTTRGHLSLGYKGSLKDAPENLTPWFSVPNRRELEVDIVFGHWAALNGKCPNRNIYALDTGCLWGGQLTALRLQDRQLFSVSGA